MQFLSWDGFTLNRQWRIEKRDLNTGGQLWAATSNPSGFDENPHAIAVDSTGVYIAGWAIYPALGNAQLWRIEKRRLDNGNLCTAANCGTAFGSGGVVTVDFRPLMGRAMALTVDSTGLYVAGWDSTDSSKQWRIQKRELANGNQTWETTSNPAVGFICNGCDDSPKSLAVDAAGLYIAGIHTGFASGFQNDQWRIEKRESGGPPPPPPPTVNLSAFPTTINSGESSTLDWWTSIDATSCAAVSPAGWTSQTGTSGAEVVWPAATTPYTISCTGPGGTTQQSTTVTVTSPPTCGGLNTSFDGDGIVTSDPSTDIDAAFTITIDSTYMYVGGSDKSPVGGNNQWRIEKRRLDNGALCTALNCGTEFGTGGAATSNMGGIWDRVNDISVDGGPTFMYVAGYDLSSGSGDGRWRIEKRRVDNGALCTAANCGTAFDTDGVVTTDPSVSRDRVNGISIDFTYMYIAGDDSSPGAFNQQWRIEKRRLDTGALCTAPNCGTAFDTDGIALSNPSPFLADQPYDIAIDSTYMYVVGFDSNTVTSNYQWRIEKRRLDTGALCTAAACGTAFGTGGAATSDPSNSTDIAYAVAIDSNYMYAVGSDASPGYFRWHIEKRRLDTGALCTAAECGTAFDTDGILTSSECAADAEAYAVAIDSASTAIYIAGKDSCTSRWRVEKRDKTTGALDLSFGVNGAAISDPSADTPQSIVIDANAIYVAGFDGSGGVQWRIEKRDLSCGVPPPLPTITLTATLPTINSGETSTLDWTSIDAASCTAAWITADGGDGVGGCDNPTPPGCI